MMETLTRLWQGATAHDGHWRNGLARRKPPKFREAPAADVLKGVAAGVVGGLVASWLMNQFQMVTQAVAGKLPSNEQHEPPHQEDRTQESAAESPQEQSPEPATVQAAQAMATPVLHRELTPTEKKVAGPAVHFGYGALMGGLYGGLVEVMPDASAGFGTAYGTALFVGGDEIGVPLFGFSEAPWKLSASIHANAFGSHLVYGIATESVRRTIRRII